MDSMHRCTVVIPNNKGKLNIACSQTYNAVCSCGRIFQIIPSTDNPATFQVLCQPPSQISRTPSLSDMDLARILQKPPTASMEHGQVDYPFKKRFGSVEYTITDSQTVNAAKFDRLRQFRRSRLADEVRTLTFIEREKGGFPILNNSLPGHEDGDIRFFRDEIRIPMTFVNSLEWFPKLETLVFSSDYVPRERIVSEITPAIEDYKSVFTSLEQLLRRRKTPLQVQVRHRDLISCEFNWTGKRETTHNISFRSLRTKTAVEEEIREMMRIALDPTRQCFYNFEIKRYCVQLKETLLKHSLRVIKLSGFTFRILDLADLFSSRRALFGPETLIINDCQIRFDEEPFSGQTIVRWTQMRAFIEDLGRTGVRHLEFVDLIRKFCRLKSFRFERFDRVFFDWDGDNQLDDGRRLPEMIRKLGGVNMAIWEMERCVLYKRILPAGSFPKKEKKQEEQNQETKEQEEEKQESGKKDAEKPEEEEDEDRYDLPDEYFGF
ncbi:hypothetical protein BC567DRAFT_287741 [Phyllosticta citribraziliensis]